MRSKFKCSAWFVLVCISSPSVAVSVSPAFELQNGIDLMASRGDYAGALRLFNGLADVPDRSVAARAGFYGAYCQERLGQPSASQRYLETLHGFPDQADVVHAARERLRVLGY